MLSDAEVETLGQRLRAPESAARALVADETTDGVSEWGQHSYTGVQARDITRALVDALAEEMDDTARESMVNALGSFVSWDLAPYDEVSRAIALPRPLKDPASNHWQDIEEWATRNERFG